MKYADYNPYLAERRRVSAKAGDEGDDGDERGSGERERIRVTLADYDRDAASKVAAALLFRKGGGYADVVRRVAGMSAAERQGVIDEATRNIGPHDAAPREFEVAGYTFEFVFDYGALREFRRHRMLTGLSQPLTVGNGYDAPPLIAEAGLLPAFEEAMTAVGKGVYGYPQGIPGGGAISGDARPPAAGSGADEPEGVLPSVPAAGVAGGARVHPGAGGGGDAAGGGGAAGAVPAAAAAGDAGVVAVSGRPASRVRVAG